MINEKEKQEIIEQAVNLAVEKTLLLIPEVIGNLMSSHAALHKINSKFYSDYPEFKEKKDIVASVVEMIEGKNPLAKHEDILIQAVPKIRERILTMKSLDMVNVNSNPNRDFKGLDILEAEKPNPHGEL
jgi:hypothetical protein